MSGALDLDGLRRLPQGAVVRDSKLRELAKVATTDPQWCATDGRFFYSDEYLHENYSALTVVKLPRPARSRRSAKAAGQSMEKLVVEYLAEHVDDRIERRRLNGSKDRGDVSSVRTFRGGRVAVECKSYSSPAGEKRAKGDAVLHIGSWLGEAEVARGNDDAVAGVVVAKRVGTTDPAEQVVFMTLRDLVALLTGERPE